VDIVLSIETAFPVYAYDLKQALYYMIKEARQ